MPRALVRAAGVLAAVATLVAAAAPAHAGHGHDEGVLGTAQSLGVERSPEPEPTTTGRWFLRFDDGAAPAAETLAAVVAAARAKGLTVEPVRTFSTLLSGASVRVGGADPALLTRLPGVVAADPVLAVDRPAPATPAVGLGPVLGSIGADDVAATGEGVLVGLVGTSVDGRALGREDLSQTDLRTDRTPAAEHALVPGQVPDSCTGPGTHLAGIVAGAREDGGVAPGADLATYRVFGCEGPGAADDVLAAMEAAAADGVDVLALPELPTAWPDYPTSVAAAALARSGTVVVVPGGAGDEAGVIAVAPARHARARSTAVLVDGEQVAYSPVAGAPAPPRNGSVELRPAGEHGAADALGCTPTPRAAGTVLVVERGACTFHDKALAAERSGALGLVLLDDGSGPFRPTVHGTPEVSVPVIAVTGPAAELLTDGAELAWSGGSVTTTSATADQPAAAARYGPAAVAGLVPDILAPGDRVDGLAAAGRAQASSGADVAAAHVAGAAALLLGTVPDAPPAHVRAWLTASAAPVVSPVGPRTLAAAHRQGAGLLDVSAALAQSADGARVSPASLALGASERPVTVAIDVHAHTDTTFRLSTEAAVSTSDAATTFRDAAARVRFPRTLDVPAGATVPVRVTITPPVAPAGTVYGGYVVLEAGDDTLHVPYTGVVGDPDDLPVLVAEPELADGGRTVVLPLTGPATVAVELFRPGADGRPAGRVPGGEVRRPDGPVRTGRAAWMWDGTVAGPSGERTGVPDGSYILRVTVTPAVPSGERARGEPVTWESPAFELISG